MSQLAFSFYNDSKNNTCKEEDFLLFAQNSAAFNFLKKFFSQKDFSTAPCSSLILKGEAVSGKTHLLNVFAKKNNAEFLNRENISLLNLSDHFVENQFYILDDASKIKDETLIFHIINSAFENHSFLILVFDSKSNFKLKDLVSRLKNIPLIEIGNLELDSAKQLLQNYLSRRQIKVSRQVINFIANRFQENYRGILDAAKLIEFHIAESGKSLSLKATKSIFK